LCVISSDYLFEEEGSKLVVKTE